VPRSGARPDERDPQTLRRALDALVVARGWEAEAAVGGLVGRWAEIVGPDLAAHVVVETFDVDLGRLALRADSTAWATQVRWLLPTLRGRLQTELGAGVVREVTVEGPTAPSWRKGPRRVPGRGPRDTYG
jgi:predicted nucleic acid-binding Zn ribbon protein